MCKRAMGSVKRACTWNADTEGQLAAGKSAGPVAENNKEACMTSAMVAAMPQPTEIAAARTLGLLGSSLNMSSL